MSCYVIESDKLFLCCKDIHVMEVYEIDSLYVAPVRKKYWTPLATVQLGDGQEFEALQIGDRDIIRGHDLERLMQDLMYLEMMVNRDGLCFLKVQKSRISDQRQVEYYRMFDLFDWSKYYVKSRLNISWVRNDIVTGRPIFDMSSDKDAEFIENRRLHSVELMELKPKYSQDIEELKRSHSKDIQELKENHSAKFAAFLLKKDEELKAKQVEVERMEREIGNLKCQVKLRCYDSSNGNFEEFYSNLVDYLRIPCPPSKFVWSAVLYEKFYSPRDDHVYHLALIPVNHTLPSDFPSVNVHNLSTLQSIDADRWWLLEVEIIFTIEKPREAETQRKTRLLYYDGEAYTVSKRYGVTYPSFCDDDNALGLHGCGVYHILGVGFRLGFLCII